MKFDKYLESQAPWPSWRGAKYLRYGYLKKLLRKVEADPTSFVTVPKQLSLTMQRDLVNTTPQVDVGSSMAGRLRDGGERGEGGRGGSCGSLGRGVGEWPG